MAPRRPGRGRGLDDEERLGRLVDDERAERAMFSGRYIKAGLRGLSAPHRPSTRPDMGHGRTTFHFQQTFVSKRPDKFGRSDLSFAVERQHPDRTYLYPRKREVAVARALGARYDRAARRPWLPAGGAAATDPRAAAMRTDGAKRAWRARALGRGRTPDLAQAGGEAARFQAYVMRGGLDEDGREAELAHDAAGPVAVSSIGETLEEAVEFWRRSEARERADGRVQVRLFVEVAHELPEEELRPLAEALGRIFAERGLPFYVGMHRADVDKGSDPRNIHVHVLHTDRPATAERDAAGVIRGWRFAPRKDREAQGRAWVAGLRERIAAELDQALDRAAARAGARAAQGTGAEAEREALLARRYDVRSYGEAETGKQPSRHLGRVRAQRERAGLPTLAGVRNAEAEADYAEVEIAAVRRVLAREATEVLERARDLRAREPELSRRAVAAAVELDQALGAAADRFEARRRAAADPAVARARLRLEWVARERRRLARRQEKLAAERRADSRPLPTLERLEQRLERRRRQLDGTEAEAIAVLRRTGGGERQRPAGRDQARPGDEPAGRVRPAPDPAREAAVDEPHVALRSELAGVRARWRTLVAGVERAVEARRDRWIANEAGRLGLAGPLAHWLRLRRRRAVAEVLLERSDEAAARDARTGRAGGPAGETGALPRRPHGRRGEAVDSLGPTGDPTPAGTAPAASEGLVARTRLGAAVARIAAAEMAAAGRLPALLRAVAAGTAPVPTPEPHRRTPRDQREREL